jgi:hypothetical protein
VQALEQDRVRRIVLTRPAVEAGEKLGFLPGDMAQKVDPYLRPLYDALYEMIGFERVARVLHRATSDAEHVLLAVGAVAFAAGAAGYLHLSSVAVAFVAGVVVANLPAEWKPRFTATLDRLERPIYLISLVVIGALWNPTDPRGWLLVPLFAGARLAGKRLAMTVASESGAAIAPQAELDRLVWAPIGPLAIVIVVNAQLLYPGGSISLVVAAVIGGAIVTEILVQLRSRRETGA